MFRVMIAALAVAGLFVTAVANAQQGSPASSTTVAAATSSPPATPIASPSMTPTASPTLPVNPAPPPVVGLEIDVAGQILRPDNSFIPPEERTFSVLLSWSRPAAFSGSYEVFRLDGNGLRERPGTKEGAMPLLLGSVSTPAGAGGEKLTFTAPIAWNLPHTCYQVRAAIGSVSGPSAQICTQVPPSSGPGAAPSVTPRPPESGTGALRLVDGGVAGGEWLPVIGALLLAAALASMLAVFVGTAGRQFFHRRGSDSGEM